MTLVSVSSEAMEDMAPMTQGIACLMWSAGIVLRPPTGEEATDGRQAYQHGDHEHTISIGWRAEQERAAEEALREAEMAACPYQACTCGHHEE